MHFLLQSLKPTPSYQFIIVRDSGKLQWGQSMKMARKSINHVIAIFVIIALVGILFVPVVSAGKTIAYMPGQRTIKSLSEVQNPSLVSPVSFPQQKYFPVIPGFTNQTVQPDSSTPIVFPPTPSVPSTGIPIQPFRKISAIAFPFISPRITPALINMSTNPRSTIRPNSAPTIRELILCTYSKNKAIRITKDSVSNISITFESRCHVDLPKGHKRHKRYRIRIENTRLGC